VTIGADTPGLPELSEALDRWNVAIYPAWEWVDESGMPLGKDSRLAQAGGTFQPQGLVGEEGSLKDFAEMTGGRRDKRGNDVGAVITEAMKDVQSGYLLKYYPAPQNWNNKFHEITVSCRRKGVLILTKTGYYAWSEPPGTQVQ
jgi:VWFA-related protein